ncbi:MAG: hypothetical protein GX211_07895 [Clostridiaceae bacterium]|jgi:hypothetical protein|nr:hypothetical protein [Clostridiaceae bacterium]
MPRSGGYAALVRVLSVTTGDMLRSPATYRKMRSGLMSDPGYGDLYVKIKQDLERVAGMCFVDLGNETPGPGPAEIECKQFTSFTKTVISAIIDLVSYGNYSLMGKFYEEKNKQ